MFFDALTETVYVDNFIFQILPLNASKNVRLKFNIFTVIF